MTQERDAGPAWDCETIVSTFSNLDNHPSVIAEPSLRGRKKKGAKEAASGLQGACVCGRGKGGRERRTVVQSGYVVHDTHNPLPTPTNPTNQSTALPEDGPAGAVSMVELSRKSGLPLGVLPARGGDGQGAPLLPSHTGECRALRVGFVLFLCTIFGSCVRAIPPHSTQCRRQARQARDGGGAARAQGGGQGGAVRAHHEYACHACTLDAPTPARPMALTDTHPFAFAHTCNRREQRQKKKEVAGVYKEADKATVRKARNPETAVARSVFKYT